MGKPIWRFGGADFSGEFHRPFVETFDEEFPLGGNPQSSIRKEL
jgi:hypothetical protein